MDYDHKGKRFRIEAWSRNSHRGNALGRKYPYFYGGKVRENAGTIYEAWMRVMDDVMKCKWKRKPGTFTKKQQDSLLYLSTLLEPTLKAVRKAFKKKAVTIHYRTPSRTRKEQDKFRQVSIVFPAPKLNDEVRGHGQTVGYAASSIQRELKRIESQAKRQAERDAYHKRKDAINAALQRAEPGDLIIQSEGEKPTLILAEKVTGEGHIKAWPLDPRLGTFLKFNFHSIQRTPRIAPMSPVVRKLLLAYVGVREKLTDHAIVVWGPDRRITFKAGKAEFGFYWRREALRWDFFPFRLDFLG